MPRMLRVRPFRHAACIALAAAFLVVSTAEAGPYPTNKCVSKKQKAAGKYARSVSKAWQKFGADPVARNAAIAKAYGKLDATWTKEEGKAVDKNASCDEATATALATAAIVDDAVTAIAYDSGHPFGAKYVDKAMKINAKYIKAPAKDPGRAKWALKIGDAYSKNLIATNVSPSVASFAQDLQVDLYVATTTAPDYPTTFQTITPGATVEYGRKTLTPRCVDGDPYVFFARKGSSNNVLMYYQGGGACWNKESCFSVPGGTCSRTADASDNPDLTTTGFGDYTNPDNPFKDWSVVFVTYCTCDVHWGENTEVYGAGQQANHFGRVNAAVAEKFAREHFLDPERVVATGSSAGSYGAIMNSYWLLKDIWPNSVWSVLGDGGVGVITQGFLNDYIDNWGVHHNFPDDLPGVSLPVQSLSMVDLIDGLAQAHPEARFGNYDSSYDGGGGSQCQFYQTMRYAFPGQILTESGRWWEPACEWNACMREFKEENATRAPNYRYFTGAGSRHTMFGSDKVYEETKSTKADGTPITIADWLSIMVYDGTDWVSADCNNPGGDCSLTNSCQGGTNAGLACAVDGDCGGGTCQHDPDTGDAPYANNGTVTCAPTDCPCGPAAAKCVGGDDVGDACASDIDCTGGTCVYVNCPTFTGP